jgi:hypothetical protein
LSSLSNCALLVTNQCTWLYVFALAEIFTSAGNGCSFFSNSTGALMESRLKPGFIFSLSAIVDGMAAILKKVRMNPVIKQY